MVFVCFFFASKVVIDDFLWFWRGKLLLHEHIAGCSKMNEKGCLQYLRVQLHPLENGGIKTSYWNDEVNVLPRGTGVTGVSARH